MKPILILLSWILCSATTLLFGLHSVSADDVRWLHNFQEAQRASTQSGKPILIHFYSNNCPPCKLLDAKAFKNRDLIESFAENLVAVKINVDDHRDLADQYQITRWPTDVYLFPNGSELHRMVSPQDPAVYQQVVERVSLRNRDWVLEQNARYQAQQKRSENSSRVETPTIAQTRVPPIVSAPGVPPKPTVGRLASYPVEQGTEERRISIPSETSGSVTFPTKEEKSTAAVPRGRSTVTEPAEEVPELPPVVSINRYRNKPSPFQDLAGQSNSQINPHAAPPSPTIPSEPVTFQPAIAPTTASPVAHDMGAPQQVTSGPGSYSSSDKYVTNPNTYAPNDAPNAFAPANEIAPVEPQAGSSALALKETLVFEGSCPVALATKKQWLPGSSQFGVRHRGRIYYCESEAARQQFLQSPDEYSPVFSGYDIVEFLESGKIVEGKREYGCWFRGQVFLFASVQASQRFQQAEKAFIEELDRIQNPGRVAETPSSTTRR